MHWLIGIPATFFLIKNTIYIKLATTLQVGPQKKTMLHPSPSTQSGSGPEAAKSPVRAVPRVDFKCKVQDNYITKNEH
jgi:hypothetical protein